MFSPFDQRVVLRPTCCPLSNLSAFIQSVVLLLTCRPSSELSSFVQHVVLRPIYRPSSDFFVPRPKSEDEGRQVHFRAQYMGGNLIPCRFVGSNVTYILYLSLEFETRSSIIIYKDKKKEVFKIYFDKSSVKFTLFYTAKFKGSNFLQFFSNLNKLYITKFLF